jgi:hypothetical protein
MLSLDLNLNLTGRALIALLALLAAAALSFAVAGGAAAAPSTGVTRECQHPMTTGQEAVNIKNVSPKTACKVVRALARFIEDGAKPEGLYKCVGLTKQHPGRPVLVIHSFEGWKLKVVNGYGLKVYRGNASFGVTGTDFPLNCT